MSVITTGAHPKAMWPGVKRWWGVSYDNFEKVWPKMFESMDSDQHYEEEVELVGFGLASVKGQSAALMYDTTQQGPVSRFTHITYALGYIVTMEELQDNLYDKVSKSRAGRLARSMAETEEIVHANVFNRAFNSSYVGGDGVALCSTAHPTANGTQSNRLAVDADLSEAAIEDMLIQIMNATDTRGLRINLKPRSLLIANANWFEANRIVNSVLQSGTANNDINVIKATNQFPDGIINNPYFDDPDAWFIRTNCRDGGLVHYSRMATTFDKDNDFDTKNAKAAAVTRYSTGWSNWRQLFGTQGA